MEGRQRSAVVVNFRYALVRRRGGTPSALALRSPPPAGEGGGAGRAGRGLGPAKDRIALCGESAHQPIRLDRIREPRLGPAVSQARLNGTRGHRAAVGVGQRQLAARLRQAALQISALRIGRPQCCGRLLRRITFGIVTHKRYRPITRAPRANLTSPAAVCSRPVLLPPVYIDFGTAHATPGDADYVYFVSNSAILAVIRINDDKNEVKNRFRDSLRRE